MRQIGRIIAVLWVVMAAWLVDGGAYAQDYGFQDRSLSDEERVAMVVGQLTLDEKIGLLSTNLGVERLGIGRCGSMEGLHGLALGGPAAMNGKREVDGKEVADDCPTTIFPQAYGLGETWDRECVRTVGEQMAEEARYYYHSGLSRRKGLVVYAPNADLARDPRWGRTEESYGEDPFLTGEMTVAMVRGLQGNGPGHWLAASLMKHFLANSNEDGRDSTSSNFDTRLFREYYSYPFYKGITEGGCRAFMASYNSWNGTPMAINPCLDAIARKEWGNDGIICTDGGAFSLLIDAHKAFPTRKEGAAAIIKAGIGQFLDKYEEDVRAALDEGLVSEADIDRVISGNLRVALRLGLLDGEDEGNDEGEGFVSARDKVLEVTRKSVVLLKNDGLLPIDRGKVRKIAVVGPYADRIVGDWYTGTPDSVTTILQAMREVEGMEILYARDNSMGRAEELAREADVVLVCTGNHPYGTRPEWFFCPVASDGREAVDRKSLSLPDEDLLRQLYAINSNTVLVLVSSFPYTINWSDDNLPAIVHITHCSQEQGPAIRDVIMGYYNPAGRTTQTWVRDLLDLPTIMDYDIRNGRTYMYADGEVLYPFGHGLSYSSFEYSDATRDGEVIRLRITNRGVMDGEEVVQVYATFEGSTVRMPLRKLCAFDRVAVRAGETITVTLPISTEAISYWDEALGCFALPDGRITYNIGASSADTRLTVE